MGKAFIKALYKNIPNNEGIVKRKYHNYTKKTVATKVIRTLLALIPSLTLNNSIFNSNFCLQIKGCALGAICATTYAKIFMSEFEKICIKNIKNKSSSYLQFIDDIFMVWTKSKNELKFFIIQLFFINKKHHSIKFDFRFSREKTEFSDTLIYKNHNNRFQIALFIKSQLTAQNYRSTHPL